MQRIFYANTSFVTSDAIAAALARVVGRLLEVGSSDLVDIPVALEDGSSSRATLLVGPSIHIAMKPEFGGHVALSDEKLVRRLEAQLERLRNPYSRLMEHPAASVATA